MLEHIPGVAIEALNNAGHIEKTIGYEAEVELIYKDLEQIKYLFEKNNIKIIDSEYKESIKLIIEIPEEKIVILETTDKLIKKEFTTKKYVEI